MGNIKRIIIAVVAVVAMAIPASAQFAIGIKGGLDVNSVSFDDLKSNFDKENRTGWMAGLTTEFTVPIVGIGFDLSVLYVHRITEAEVSGDPSLNALLKDENYRKQDFIEIPLNLKYKLNIPGVNKIVAPFVTTGPSVAFKCSKEAAVEAYKEKKFDAAWNAGGGLQLFGHLQVGVNYSWGLTKSIENVVHNEPVNIKNNGWKITAAYYF